MPKRESYELVGIGQEPAAPYGCAGANEFLAQVREHILNSEQAARSSDSLRNLLDEQLREAYHLNHPESLHAIHVSLNEILFWRFNFGRHDVEHSPLLFEVQQQIIVAQLKADLSVIHSEVLPATVDSFERWFEERCKLDGREPHPLFDFLETRANLKQFRRFIEVDAGVHVPFDDVIALAQVGVRGSPKGEFLHNLQDEIGNSEPDKFHLTMFQRLVKGLGIRSIRRVAMPWEALACGSYMMFLSYFRRYYPYCVGYLGFLEALTPARFGCMVRGGTRLGIATSLLQYHAEHSELDTDHAHGWLHNIILPAIHDNGVRMSRDIAAGVCLRDRVARRYWDSMLTELIAEAPLK